jgi:hypothetical protein
MMETVPERSAVSSQLTGHSSPLTILGWLWKDERCRTQYGVEHANIWARMIDRNLTIPHRFVLLTDPHLFPPPRRAGEDEGGGFDPLIELYPLWPDYRELVSPGASAKKPQCYTRLRAFSEDMRAIAGDRFISIDLDCVVTGSLDEMFSRDEDFIICQRAPLEDKRLQVGDFQASMWMLKTGSRTEVWEDFHGLESLQALRAHPRAKEYLLADQGWMLYKLGDKDEATWDMEDGVYDWRYLNARLTLLLGNARIVFFPGADKPWDLIKAGTAPQWLRENYR